MLVDMALSIIGAGFGRTGTASLKLALERLGIGPCHHMTEVLQDPTKIERWRRIGAGEALWDDAFDGYRSTVDWPACTHWRSLMAHYPDAKVILSLRDASTWFDSVHETILNPAQTGALRGTPFGEMLDRNIWRLFDGRLGDRSHMMGVFERHNDAVRRGVPADRLLVFDAKQGWAPLCAFLGVPAPSVPFPHVNSREETKRVMELTAAQAARGGAISDIADSFVDKMYKHKP